MLMHVYAYTRKGVHGTSSWLDKMSSWVAAWLRAYDDLIQEDAPYDPRTYEEYIEWYNSQTRLCCVQVVVDPPRHEATTSDTYPTWPDSAFHRSTDLHRVGRFHVADDVGGH